MPEASELTNGLQIVTDAVGDGGVILNQNFTLTDAHIGNSSNPHSVTALQAGAIANGGTVVSIATGALASRPAAGTQGKLYLSTDEYFIDYDDGTSWVRLGAGDPIFALIDDTTPQLGGDLDLNEFSIGGVTEAELVNVTGLTSNAQTQLDAKLENVEEDITPQLGGNLDVNGYSIVSAGSADIVVTPDGTGNVEVHKGLIVQNNSTSTGYFYCNPISNAQVVLSFTTVSGESLMTLDPLPADGTSSATFRFFRSTNTTGAVSFSVFKGNGTATANHTLSGNQGSYLCADRKQLTIGAISGASLGEVFFASGVELNMNSNKITSLADGSASGDAVNFSQLTAATHAGFIDVTTYGATGDGVTNDTADVASAIAALPSSGGQLYFPAGTYLLDQITFTSLTHLRVTGAKGARLELNDDANDRLMYFDSCRYVEIDHLQFEGVEDSDATYNATNPHRIIEINAGGYFDIHTNYFEKFTSQAMYIHDLDGGTTTEGVRIHDNIFENAPYDDTVALNYAIWLQVDGEYSSIYNNQFRDIAAAIRCSNGGANVTILNNIILDCIGGASTNRTDRAVIFCDATGANYGKVLIQGNLINHNETRQYAIICTGGTVNSYHFVNNKILLNGNASQSVMIRLNACDEAVFIGNQIRSGYTVSPLIYLNSSNHVKFIGNDFVGGSYAVQASAVNTPCVWLGNTQNAATAKTLNLALGDGTNLRRIALLQPNDAVNLIGATLTTRNNVPILSIPDTSSTIQASWLFKLPQHYSQQGLVFKIRWTSATGAAGNVLWYHAGDILANIDSVSVSTLISGVSTAPGTNGGIVEETYSVTAAATLGTPVVGDLFLYTIRRNSGQAPDTLNEAAQIESIEILDYGY